jgi:enamine deaminase RidA (YjgF/YER057c/UK114 family)
MTASHRLIQPDGWAAPRGYANGVAAEGRIVFVAGQVGWNARGQFESDDLVAQIEQALANIVTVLRTAGGAPEHLVRLTWYLTDKSAYIARRQEIGQAYRRAVGAHFPSMTLVVVAGLLEDRALVEIEATAVVPRAF